MAKNGALVFIDTNIFLDFYRHRTQEGSLSILDRVNENLGSMITSNQVEMEFKKNRPAAILEFYKSIPNFNMSVKLPAYLKEAKQGNAINKCNSAGKKSLTIVRERIINVIKTPGRFDPVYKKVQRLFKTDGEFNLSRTKDIRFRLRRLAAKRWFLGYPPRKPNDNSIGDAINWEWIIYCANKSGRDIVIVSRDTDYGCKIDENIVLNEWLRQEFVERVSKRRKLILTERLTEALKLANIRVTPAEEKVEEDSLKEDDLFRGVTDEEFSNAIQVMSKYKKVTGVLSIELGKLSASPLAADPQDLSAPAGEEQPRP